MQQELVTLATYPQAWEAQVAKNYLEENGIRAFLEGENSALSGWNLLTTVKLQVASADAEKANELLSETKPNDNRPD